MNKNFKHPFIILSEVLNISSEEINYDSCIGMTHNWDSLNHIVIISAIETEYSIKIDDSEIMKYNNMKTILELYENLNRNPKIL